jgi:hypothetical protein
MSTPTPTNNGNFDLTGVFKVQDKYITDLGKGYPDVNGAPQIVGYVADLQNQMTNLAKQYQDANTSSNVVLDHQNEMIQIINDEQDRLNKKKVLIDNVDFQQNRQALLNNTYRLKYAEYTKIVIVIIVSLLIFLLLSTLSSLYESIPPLIIIVLHIANITIAAIIITYIYAKIYSRSNINFDEIVLPPPITDASGTNGVNQDGSGNIFGRLGICYKETCCGAGTVWDPNFGICVIKKETLPPTAAKSAQSTKITTTPAKPQNEKFTTLTDAYLSSNLLDNSYTASRNVNIKSNFIENIPSQQYSKL